MSEPKDTRQESITIRSLSRPHSTEAYSTFSPKMRLYLTYLLGLVMLTSTLTATIYAPLIPLLSKHFGVSTQAMNLTVTTYAIFQATSPALFASLADAVGRRPVLLGLLVFYSLASLGLVLNRHSYGLLLALRALQSIGGAPTVPISYGIVADVAPVSGRGKMLGPMLSSCNAIAAIGPVIGGALATGRDTEGFVWVFLALLSISITVLLLTGLTLPETARNIVGNGSKPARGIWTTWSANIQHLFQKKRQPQPYVEGVGSRSWRPLDALAPIRIIFYPDSFAVLWLIASSYSVYFTFQTAVPVIFAEIYGYNELEIGLSLLAVLVGLTAGGLLAGKLLDRNYAKTSRRLNMHQPPGTTQTDSRDFFPLEIARYRNVVPFVCLEIILISGYGWAVHFNTHPAVPLVIQFLTCATSTILMHTASALLVDIFPDLSGTAYASGQMMRCGLSAASVAALQPLIDEIGRGWYFTAFGIFVGLTSLVAILISRKWGMIWRKRRQNFDR